MKYRGKNLISTHDIEARIAALDTGYQAAVKINDSATMDRILVDNFILVTGRGTVYNKTDLINAAKNQDAVYEYQDDTQQAVRVRGVFSFGYQPSVEDR